MTHMHSMFTPRGGITVPPPVIDTLEIRRKQRNEIRQTNTDAHKAAREYEKEHGDGH